MKRERGHFVKFTGADGQEKTGRTCDKREIINGKVQVTLLTDKLAIEKDDDGNPKTPLLVDPRKLKIIGFID